MSGSDTSSPHETARVQPTDDALPADRFEHAIGRLHPRSTVRTAGWPRVS